MVVPAVYSVQVTQTISFDRFRIALNERHLNGLRPYAFLAHRLALSTSCPHDRGF